MKRQTPVFDEFRIKLVTEDGQLVQNRKDDSSWFFSRFGMDMQMVEISLRRDCTEKGCRLIAYSGDDKTGIVGIVEWLK